MKSDPKYFKKYDNTLILLAVSAEMHPEQLRLRIRELRRGLTKEERKKKQ